MGGERIPLAPTSDRWVSRARGDLAALLLDHAHCEKKAAATALGFVFRAPERTALCVAMSRLAREELVHFERLLGILAERGSHSRSRSPRRMRGGSSSTSGGRAPRGEMWVRSSPTSFSWRRSSRRGRPSDSGASPAPASTPTSGTSSRSWRRSRPDMEMFTSTRHVESPTRGPWRGDWGSCVASKPQSWSRRAWHSASTRAERRKTGIAEPPRGPLRRARSQPCPVAFAGVFFADASAGVHSPSARSRRSRPDFGWCDASRARALRAHSGLDVAHRELVRRRRARPPRRPPRSLGRGATGGAPPPRALRRRDEPLYVANLREAAGARRASLPDGPAGNWRRILARETQLSQRSLGGRGRGRALAHPAPPRLAPLDRWVLARRKLALEVSRRVGQLGPGEREARHGGEPADRSPRVRRAAARGVGAFYDRYFTRMLVRLVEDRARRVPGAPKPTFRGRRGR